MGPENMPENSELHPDPVRRGLAFAGFVDRGLDVAAGLSRRVLNVVAGVAARSRGRSSARTRRASTPLVVA